MEIPVPVQPSWLRRASAPLPGLSAPGRLFDQRFGEGLRLATDKLNEKNFYAFNPSFDKNCSMK